MSLWTTAFYWPVDGIFLGQFAADSAKSHHLQPAYPGHDHATIRGLQPAATVSVAAARLSQFSVIKDVKNKVETHGALLGGTIAIPESSRSRWFEGCGRR